MNSPMQLTEVPRVKHDTRHTTLVAIKRNNEVALTCISPTGTVQQHYRPPICGLAEKPQKVTLANIGKLLDQRYGLVVEHDSKPLSVVPFNYLSLINDTFVRFYTNVVIWEVTDVASRKKGESHFRWFNIDQLKQFMADVHTPNADIGRVLTAIDSM